MAIVTPLARHSNTQNYTFPECGATPRFITSRHPCTSKIGVLERVVCRAATHVVATAHNVRDHAISAPYRGERGVTAASITHRISQRNSSAPHPYIFPLPVANKNHMWRGTQRQKRCAYTANDCHERR
ncbi:hypothetical protein [Burkholderia vietnamiensis]|jgi:hypothetical protein|uniref:hypothetical protein n=1 Tax=Burkholderia vietnamiensis TaxID=60552 RepID=UPI000B257D24|nr:hypothetical protein [Burkholderia vietnamiensis]